MKKDYLRFFDLDATTTSALVERAIALKGGADAMQCPLIGRSIGLIFEKSSTRTRVSFEVGVYQLGGQPIVLSAKDIQLGRGESVADTAQVLSRYLSAVTIRTFEHERVEEFAQNATIPVVNALTDDHHPCQALSDLMTIREKLGRTGGFRMAYIGDGNNMAHSLMEAATLMGFSLSLACPEGYDPDKAILDECLKRGGDIKIVRKPSEAAAGADVLYTDVWISMGKEEESNRRKRDFEGYQINSGLVALAAPGAIVMHCLPAYRGMEITDEALASPASVVLDQAENRLHAQKALLEYLLK